LEIKSCKQAWLDMTAATQRESVRNYLQLLDMADYLVETELFPAHVLDAYSTWNLEQDISDDQQQFFNSVRGGGQGDYREGMAAKIANVVDCLSSFPGSKRAIITVNNDPHADHRDDDAAKCMRELHLYLDDENQLCGTVLFRAQAALIFPKNIHFIGSLMTVIASQLPQRPNLGPLFYLATILVSDRA
jgi:hypothetical protein